MRIVRVAGWAPIFGLAVACGDGDSRGDVTTGTFDASRDAIAEASAGNEDDAALEGDSPADGSPPRAAVLSPEAGPAQRNATPEAECLYVSSGCLCGLRGEHCDAVRMCCGGYGLACTGNGICDVVGPN